MDCDGKQGAYRRGGRGSQSAEGFDERLLQELKQRI
jgi:hypothetical protein